jgi:hypothetical protein
MKKLRTEIFNYKGCIQIYGYYIPRQKINYTLFKNNNNNKWSIHILYLIIYGYLYFIL